MANLKLAKTEEELKSMRIADIKKSYIEIGGMYNKLIDGDYLKCPKCGEIMKADTAFYMDKNYATNRYPICKKCILKIVEQRKNDRDTPNETKESVQKVLQMMDRVYDDSFYEECVKGAMDETQEKLRNSPFATYITATASLPQWRGKTWKDSNFGESALSVDENETRIIQKTVKSGKKRFGSGYSDDEYMFLENEYQDWITRYECNTKAQEEVFENLSTLKLLKKKAMVEGKPTKDLDSQQQNWLDTGSLKPKQNMSDTLSDAQTFGTLIQKWEETRPLPDVDPELKDIDKIGLLIDVFFKGHTSKMMGLKNNFTNIYEKFMKKYTVNKPEYDGDEDSEAIFEKVFGSINDD